MQRTGKQHKPCSSSKHGRKQNRMRHSLPFILLFLLILTGTILYQNHQKRQYTNLPSTEVFSDITELDTYDTTVHFLDVGQGNATLIESDGHYMLIDGGDRNASSFVVSYLKDQGVKTLDYIIVSHYDADHINGVIGALYQYKVSTVLCPDYEADTKTYQSYLTALQLNGAKVIYPEQGSSYSLGNSTFTVVCPYTYTYSDENNNSVGIRFVCGENSFLILGDASEQSESDMLITADQLNSDVYLASHHGSYKSSSTDFLEAVKPEYTIISCGADNDYGHPHKDTLDRIKATGSQLFRTDEQGTIIAKSDGHTITFSQSPCNDFTPGKQQGHQSK